jgi:hypothetical protein
MNPRKITVRFYNINQQNAETLEDVDNVGKTTSETEEAVA